jgi:hypothetical protein
MPKLRPVIERKGVVGSELGAFQFRLNDVTGASYESSTLTMVPATAETVIACTPVIFGTIGTQLAKVLDVHDRVVQKPPETVPEGVKSFSAPK